MVSSTDNGNGSGGRIGKAIGTSDSNAVGISHCAAGSNCVGVNLYNDSVCVKNSKGIGSNVIVAGIATETAQLLAV